MQIIAAILFAIWLVLIALGKGGFVHLLLLNAVVISVIDLISVYRGRLKES